MSKRIITKDLDIGKNIYNAICLLGPKGSGKTELALNMARHFYTFDNINTLLSAKEDPAEFVAKLRTPAVIQEAHKVPEIFKYLSKEISGDISSDYKYVLTSSFNIADSELSKKIPQNIGMCEVYPLTIKEINGKKDDNIINKLFNGGFLDEKYTYIPKEQIYKTMLKGTLVDLQKVKSNVQREIWFNSYITTTFLKSAIEQLELRFFDKFLKLLKMLSVISAAVINKSELYHDLGIDNKTLDSYLKLLEQIYQIAFIEPFTHDSIKRKYVKSPKIFFIDTGLLCYLLGLKSADDISDSVYVNNIFETFIFSELYKYSKYSDENCNISFFRTITKKDVHFILQRGGENTAINFKFTSSVQKEDFKPIRSLKDIIKYGIVFYTGEEILDFNDNKKDKKYFAIPISLLF